MYNEDQKKTIKHVLFQKQKQFKKQTKINF